MDEEGVCYVEGGRMRREEGEGGRREEGEGRRRSIEESDCNHSNDYSLIMKIEYSLHSTRSLLS